MSTTVVFVEFLIAGMQASAWLAVILLVIVGPEPLASVSTVLRDFAGLTTLVLVAIWYTVGIIIDQVGNVIFTLLDIPGLLMRSALLKRLIEMRPGLTVRTAVLAEVGNVAGFLDYNRSRIRIMRATTLNVCLVEITLAIVSVVCPEAFCVRFSARQATASIIAGVLFTGACIATLGAVEVGYDVYLEQISKTRSSKV